MKSDELQRADHAWKTAVLLLKLLEAEGKSHDTVSSLCAKSLDWMRAHNSDKKAVGLNTARFLFKGQHLAYSAELLHKVVDILFSDTSLAVKLAALDFLGAMSTTPNPLTRLSPDAAAELTHFRSELMKQTNASQRAYLADGLRMDIAKEQSGRTPAEALKNILARIESAS